MKKVLLGWLAIGSFACFGSVALAANCDGGDVLAGEIQLVAPGYAIQQGISTDQAVAEITADVNANGGAATNVIGSSLTAVNLIAGNINIDANVIGLGGGLGSANVNSIEGMAAVAASGYNCGWELWLNPFATWAQDDGKVVTTGFAGATATRTVGAYDADVYGANLGVTKRFNSWYIGAMFGYANTDVDYTRGAWGGYTSDNYTLALYGGFEKNNFFANLAAGYTWIDYQDVQQSVTLVSGFNGRGYGPDYDGDVWFTDIEVGYNFNLANCWTITPTIGWQYAHLETDAYNLTSPAGNIMDGTALGSAWLRVNDNKYWSSRMPIMVKVARDFGAANVFVQGGYIREFNDKAPAVGLSTANTAYVGYGNTPSQNYGTVGAGVKGSIGRWNLGLSYDYLWNTDEFDSHTVNGYIGITF